MAETTEVKTTGQEITPTPATSTADAPKKDEALSPEIVEELKKLLGDDPTTHKDTVQKIAERYGKDSKWVGKINADARQAAADKKQAEEDRLATENLKKEIEGLKGQLGTKVSREVEPEDAEIEKVYRAYCRELGVVPDDLDMNLSQNKAWVKQTKDQLRLTMELANQKEALRLLLTSSKEKEEESFATKTVREWDADAVKENEAYRRACEGPFAEDVRGKVWEFLNSNAQQAEELMKTAKGREQLRQSMMDYISSKENLWKRLSEGVEETKPDEPGKHKEVAPMAPAGRGLTGGKPPKSYEELTEQEQIAEAEKFAKGEPTPYFRHKS